MAKFSELGLKKEIIRALSSLGYNDALEVQEKIIPLTLRGKNVVFTSKTGSGKTLSFSLGYLSKINKKLGCQMLIVVPTRELAIQVSKEIKPIAEILDLNVGTLFGGREIKFDYLTLRKRNHILVATPGRLVMHVNEKSIKIGDVNYLVFDESDQMFDNGFYTVCAYIKSRVGKLSQIILSSATITDKVTSFIDEVIVEYELLKIGDKIPENISQEKVYVEIPQKEALLVNLLQEKKYKKVLLFTNRKDRAYELTQNLIEKGIRARQISGDLELKERVDNLNLFKQGKVHVLVATDIAARGLHIPQVDLVINYDVPTRTELYVHRIGRTGRVDAKGHAITFICKEDKNRFFEILDDYDVDVKEIERSKIE